MIVKFAPQARASRRHWASPLVNPARGIPHWSTGPANWQLGAAVLATRPAEPGPGILADFNGMRCERTSEGYPSHLVLHIILENRKTHSFNYFACQFFFARNKSEPFHAQGNALALL